jgi:hypothetical protein
VRVALAVDERQPRDPHAELVRYLSEIRRNMSRARE